MTDTAAFLRAVCERPADDAPRLVYADWLDEHGAADHAEFIRLQVRPPAGCAGRGPAGRPSTGNTDARNAPAQRRPSSWSAAWRRDWCNHSFTTTYSAGWSAPPSAATS